MQAILATEPALSGKACLKSAVEVLLKVAREAVTSRGPAQESCSSDDAADDAAALVATEPVAVHALNILRALFRDSRLAEHVVTFVPEAVEVAIAGFSASLWPVSLQGLLLGGNLQCCKVQSLRHQVTTKLSHFTSSRICTNMEAIMVLSLGIQT